MSKLGDVYELAAMLLMWDVYGDWDNPNWEPVGHAVVSADDVLERIKGEHYGDCTKQPVTCARCEAEWSMNGARWLIRNGWGRI